MYDSDFRYSSNDLYMEPRRTCSKFVSRIEKVCSLLSEVQSESEALSSPLPSSSAVLSSSESEFDSEKEQLPSDPAELSSSDSESSSESTESVPVSRGGVRSQVFHSFHDRAES